MKHHQHNRISASQPALLFHMLLVWLLALPSGVLHAQPVATGISGNAATPDPAAIHEFAVGVLQDLLVDEDLQGAAVALVMPGEEVISEGRGLAIVEQGLAFTGDTLTAQHELAQLFTAMAVLQLADSGQVQLDAPFTTWFPGFQPFGNGGRTASFTIRQLLSHHSGLPAYYAPNSGFEAFEYSASGADFATVLEHGSELAMVAAPGEVYEYSYLGYTLLGLLVEKISGLNFAEYITTHILQPLGMEHTYFVTEPASVSGIATATAYRDSKPVEHEKFRDIPAAGLVSSASDMGRFIKAILSPDNGLLSEASRTAMFRPQNAAPLDANLAIGLGYFITPVTGGIFRDLPTASHASTDGATRTYLIALPEQQLGVLITTNSQLSSVKLRDAADRILEEMLGKTSFYTPAPFVPHPEVPLDQGRSTAISGLYSGPGGTYFIESNRKGLSLDVPYLPFLRVSLIPRSDDFYGVEIRVLGLRLGMISQLQQLNESIEGKVIIHDDQRLIYWYWRGVAAVTLTEVIPAADSPEFRQWQQLAGDYRSALTGATYRLAFDRDSGNFTFGYHESGFRLIREPPDLFCLEAGQVMHTCGKGLVGNGSRNVLRAMADGSLQDAYGVVFTR